MAGRGAGGALLLALDVGNTQTVAGLYRGAELAAHWRAGTVATRTADELAADVWTMLAVRGLEPAAVGGVVVSSTVPQLAAALDAMARAHLGVAPLVVTGATAAGIELRVDAPAEVGPDRIANAAAAGARFGGPAVVVDFGTSTNFDVVAADGAYVGGAIAPGVAVGMEALYARAARLSPVELAAPARAIGTSTVANLRSGAVFGAAGMVDGLVARIRAELGAPGAPAVATGGLAPLVAPHCATVAHVEPWLTLDGLRLIWERAHISTA